MFAVEIYAAVRRFVFIEGKSRLDLTPVARTQPADRQGF